MHTRHAACVYEAWSTTFILRIQCDLHSGSTTFLLRSLLADAYRYEPL